MNRQCKYYEYYCHASWEHSDTNAIIPLSLYNPNEFTWVQMKSYTADKNNFRNADMEKLIHETGGKIQNSNEMTTR